MIGLDITNLSSQNIFQRLNINVIDDTYANNSSALSAQRQNSIKMVH